MSLSHSSAHDGHSESHLSSTPTPSHLALAPPSCSRASDDRILTVDWDGPDDPENPRKYASRMTSISALTSIGYLYVVGASARSGKQQ